MRYEDWDILIFPSDRCVDPGSSQVVKVPLKEFKVACHVVPDHDNPHGHGSPGLPVMTCFVPGLTAGTPFHISIHSWRTPEISHYTKSFSKHKELVQFEARIYIDGRLVSSTVFARNGSWPYLITKTFEFTKSGELEPFRFPHFRRELLFHDHWHPGDDIGRIKIVLSEGFPRDSLTNPIERVKNVVAFSFQHAPLDILEANQIAWPNPSMWKGNITAESRSIAPYHTDDGSDSHSHSPRRQAFARNTANSIFATPVATQQLDTPLVAPGLISNPMFGHSLSYLPQMATSVQGTGAATPLSYGETAIKHFANPEVHTRASRAARKSSTDASMPDYDYVFCGDGQDSAILDSFQISTAIGVGAGDDECALGNGKAPADTSPMVGSSDGSNNCSTSFSFNLPGSVIHKDMAVSLTHSLLSQPQPLPGQLQMGPFPSSDVKSRKEMRNLIAIGSQCSPASQSPRTQLVDRRNFSSTTFNVLEPTSAVASVASTPSESQFSAISQQQLCRILSDSRGERQSFSSSAGSRACPSGDAASSGANMAEGVYSTTAAPVGANPTTTGLTGSNTLDKSNKRSRTFTPASAKVIDEEDEPRRVSPRAKGSVFAGDCRSDD